MTAISEPRALDACDGAGPEPGVARSVVLAGGCFWCTEAVFAPVRGVLEVESGYANGHWPQPTYEQVCSGRSGHAEAIRLVFDPAQVGLRTLLEIFFATHDPTTLNRQGADVGSQYRSAIYWTEPEQERVARALIDELQAADAFGAPIVTELAPLQRFDAAEAEHQRFFARHPHNGYCLAVAAPKLRHVRLQFAQWLR
jgi:peptide-methionine (S)-S-oxide reductase